MVKRMVSMEEMGEMLDEIAGKFPDAFYKELNGGIILLPDAKLHQKNVANDLYVMGEYHRDQNLGRYISIFYGSFASVYGNLSKEQLKIELEGTLKHEFRHHLESLAGEYELETEDREYIADYLKKYQK